MELILKCRHCGKIFTVLVSKHQREAYMNYCNGIYSWAEVEAVFKSLDKIEYDMISSSVCEECIGEGNHEKNN